MSQTETAAANAPRTRREDRPLSPHLGIYRWQISMTLSILHRITGFALVMGTTVLVAWLWGVAYNAALYECVVSIARTLPGQILLIGWTWAFYFHFGNGIRHLIWDAGYGFKVPVMNKTGWLVVIFSFAMTALTWMCILKQQESM